MLHHSPCHVSFRYARDGMPVSQCVYLHIGQPKTGSTSLQKALAAHPDQLAAAGVFYAVSQGREDHHGEIADLLLGPLTTAATHPNFHARLLRDAVPGSWERLLERLAVSEMSPVISDETMSEMPSWVVRRVVNDLTADAPDRAKVVLAVRPLSDLLPSAYAQLAQDVLVPSFEMWTRTWLLARTRRLFRDTDVDWTNGYRVAQVWAASGAEVVCVEYRSDSREYWGSMLEALGLEQVREQIHEKRANPSMTALGLAAWQRFLRSGVDPFDPAIKRLRKAVRAGIPEISQTSSSGRLSLLPDIAELVDAAYPQPRSGRFAEVATVQSRTYQGSAAAIEQLEERLRSPQPLTTQPLNDRGTEVAALTQRIAELHQQFEPHLDGEAVH